MDLTRQPKGITLIGTGVAESGTQRLPTDDLGGTIREPGLRSPRGRGVHPSRIVDVGGNVIRRSHCR